MKCSLILFVAFYSAVAANAESSSLPVAEPESVGMSSDRLERMHSLAQQVVDESKHAGIVTAVARRGKLVDLQTYGYRDLDSKAPMTTDSIFRIYSMTKTIVSVAAMILVEEGKVDIHNPISEFIPAFADTKVFFGGTTEKPLLKDPDRPITIHHLLTHTSGLTRKNEDGHPVDRMYAAHDPIEAPDFDSYIQQIARMPLRFEPGTEFNYGQSIDVLGYVVEKASGQKLDEFLHERIFEPLKMVDTSFSVPKSKRHRLATVYRTVEGKLVALQDLEDFTPGEPLRNFPNGGGGLYSTPGDYLNFAQMLLNKGVLNGKRVLGKMTVEFMIENHLGMWEDPTNAFSRSDGFGLGGSLRLYQHSANTLLSQGRFGWGGAATTLYRIDPKEELIVMLFAQHRPIDPYKIFNKYINTVAQAIVE